MEEMGVIRKVEEPTDWCHPHRIGQENGSIRLCLDLTRLIRMSNVSSISLKVLMKLWPNLESVALWVSLLQTRGFDKCP